jgi:hypothetical protein|nr:MAG TPA: hypothetical protein [Podoviridae sp. ctY3D12]
MREMQNKIDTLRADKASLEAAALTQAQTANLVNQLRPCPVPAYLTCSPYAAAYGYPTGYSDGCGCGCGC